MIEQRIKDLYEEINKKYPNMFDMGVMSKDGINPCKVALYKRDERENICFCIELKKDKVSVIYPYYSKFGFHADKKTKIYKSVAYSNWEKAIKMVKDFEERKIEWKREYL